MYGTIRIHLEKKHWLNDDEGTFSDSHAKKTGPKLAIFHVFWPFLKKANLSIFLTSYFEKKCCCIVWSFPVQTHINVLLQPSCTGAKNDVFSFFQIERLEFFDILAIKTVKNGQFGSRFLHQKTSPLHHSVITARWHCNVWCFWKKANVTYMAVSLVGLAP